MITSRNKWTFNTANEVYHAYYKLTFSDAAMRIQEKVFNRENISLSIASIKTVLRRK